MDSYINPNNPYDFGGAIQRGLEGGTRKRVTREAKSYFDEGDYDRAAKTILPYDPDTAQNYLTVGKRQADQEYSSGLTPYLAKNDFEGAKRYAVTKNRGADDLMKLQDWAVSAKDQEKKAMAEKIDQGAGLLFAASQLAESGDMDGWNAALDELEGQGFDVKNFKGRPYNRAQLQAELVKSEKGLKILGVLQDERKTAATERRADAAELSAQAAWEKANRPDKVDEGVGGSGYSKDQLSAANTYRDDYNNQTKEFRTLASEMRRSEAYYTRAFGGQPSGQGDIGLVYALAKAYDPTSVVREGEFNTMNASSGVKNKLTGLYTKAAGEGFSPAVRSEIMRELRSQYNAQKALFDQTRAEYVRQAETIRVDPNMVAMDYSAGVPQPAKRPDELPNARQHPGKIMRDTETGKRWKSVNGAWVPVK